jgi:hypothetical protein
VKKEIHVRATREWLGHVEWTTEADAEVFSVYIGHPGDFAWDADFARKADALAYGQRRAMIDNFTFVDRIGEL